MPNSYNYANVTNVRVTPTQTIFSMVAGPMNVTLTFLSPVEVSAGIMVRRLANEKQPSDWVKQSLPFSYLSLEATSRDGKPHAVQFYSGITAGTSSPNMRVLCLSFLPPRGFLEWASGDSSSVVAWDSFHTSSAQICQVTLQKPQPDTEISNQAQDGVLYFATTLVSGQLTFDMLLF